MPVIRFTELSLENLKSEKQTRFFDSALANFGIVCGKRRKTFFVVTGEERRLKTLVRFPTLTLKAARREALAILDGTIAATTENVLVYATSNRRHLMPEYMHENLETKYVDEEVHPGETVEEKISLSERFGLWVSFYPFDQEHYLDIARYWVGVLGVTDPDQEELRREALQWALSRGSRSGRVAWHFARDYAGRRLLEARRGRKAGR